jgi:hypothetical protein
MGLGMRVEEKQVSGDRKKEGVWSACGRREEMKKERERNEDEGEREREECQ